MRRQSAHIDPQHPIHNLAPDPLAEFGAVADQFAAVSNPGGLGNLGFSLVWEVFREQGLDNGR